jgi:hypothetical protein
VIAPRALAWPQRAPLDSLAAVVAGIAFATINLRNELPVLAEGVLITAIFERGAARRDGLLQHGTHIPDQFVEFLNRKITGPRFRMHFGQKTHFVGVDVP